MNHAGSEFLKPFLGFPAQNEPGIYFFQNNDPLFDSPETTYIGRAQNVYRRLCLSEHHIIRVYGFPTGIKYLPLPGATDDDLAAAENSFILLFRPKLNERFPRPSFGQVSAWVRMLVGRVDEGTRRSFLCFLLAHESFGCQMPIWKLIKSELVASIPEADQVAIALAFCDRS